MNTVRFLPLFRGFSTGVTRTADANVHPTYLKLKATQQKFQADNGLRVSYLFNVLVEKYIEASLV
jgi:hypothetical protein